MLRLGVIGAGDVVRVRHLPILREFYADTVRIEVVATRRRDVALEVCNIVGYKCDRVDGYLDLLERDVDAVLVAVPTGVTETVVAETLSRGLPTYSEKPMAQSLVGAQRLRALAARTGAPYLVGENFWYQKRFAAAERKIGQHSAGVRTIDVADHLRRGGREHPRSDIELIWEHVPHALNAARRLAGGPIGDREVYATVGDRDGMTELDLLATAVSGASTTVRLRIQEEWSQDDYRVELADGTHLNLSHRFDFDSRTYTDTLVHGNHSEVFRLAECGIHGCWEDFLAAVRGDRSRAERSLHLAEEHTQIIEAARLSVDHGGVAVPVISTDA